MKRTPQKTPAHSGKSFWLFVLVGLVFWTASDTFVLAGSADATEAATENACTNGSFEILGKNGFPADWGPVGQQVSVSEDAHSGQRSLQMVRTAETVTPETGLNRTRLITELKGGVDFWYKAISASPGTNLNIYVIPINEEGVERTGSPRATFTVPEDHIGDGQWHHARLKYDYTDNPKVKSVHFAARIVGTTGELLLDDFQYISRVGPVPLIKKLMLEEDTKQPGRSGKVRVLLTNAGDEPARDVHLVVQTAGAAKGPTAELQLPVLAPEEIKPLYFPLPMIRQQAVMITATAKCGELSDTRRLELNPALRVRSFGPAEPVVVQGQAAVLECELENTGQVILSGITVTFETPLGQARQVVQSLAPTRKTVVRHTFIPQSETVWASVKVRVEARGIPIVDGSGVQTTEGQNGLWSAESGICVVKAISAPPPPERLVLSPTPIPMLGNKYFRVVFYPCEQRFFAGRLEVNTPQGWRVAGWLVSMGRLVLRDPRGQPEEYRLAASSCLLGPPKVRTQGELVFECPVKTRSGANITVQVRVEAYPEDNRLRLTGTLKADQPIDLLAWGLPLVYVHQRDEAVFPGLEWLVDDELSSDSLDIAADHPDRVRYVVHPHMVTIPVIGIHGPHGTVGVRWDSLPPSQHRRVAVAFASPDRFNHQRSHLVEIFLPPVPEYTPVNHRVAEKPYHLDGQNPLVLAASIQLEGQAADALSPIEDYVKSKKPDPAHPLPHTSFPQEIVFSTRAYLESLWDAETRKWWTTKGNAILSSQGLPPDFAADLMLGAMLTTDQDLKKRCLDRVSEVCQVLRLPPRLDALRIGGRADRVWANAGRVVALLASRRDDGSWRFDADRPGTGPFVGMDYRELGPHDALEVGTCARNAYEVLAFARITDDQALYREMILTLELMEQFRVPRAAQVWEVPVHTPDILAAADAVDAYLEAYRISGEKRWLDDAILWARRGLPFVYSWSDAEKPYLQGASIPVFGATWYRGSWFGRPVQWNGLRYANALLKLAEYDESQPWRGVAELLVRSAIHQQDQEGENVALWPDNISAIDGEKCPWVFAPRQIIGCITKLLGRDEEPTTVYVPAQSGRFAITSCGKIEHPQVDGKGLHLTVTFPPGEVGPVIIANVGQPAQVTIDGQAVPQNDQPHLQDGSAWCYDPGGALLTIQVGVTGPAKIDVMPAGYQRVERIPRLVTILNFQFDEGIEGWIAAHDVGDLKSEAGCLVGRITGPDPYIVRPNVRVSGDSCPTLIIRMATTAGRMAQFFWITEQSPAFNEEKSLRFEVQPDGQIHEYRLDVGSHPQWKGQTVIGLRLDPGGGTAAGEFKVDAIGGVESVKPGV